MKTKPGNQNFEHSGVTVEDFSVLPAEPLVSICCVTYNHEKFIRDAIEGFLIQKTDFPIEILIHDDASTDGTADIVRKYQAEHPDLIRAVYQTENRFLQGLKNSPILYHMSRGKHIALCEGDDYWTDPLKLQKQANFLGEHTECSICFHKVLRKHENNQQKPDYHPNFQGDQIFNKIDLYWKCFIQTCSVVFRCQPMEDYFEKSSKLSIGDWPLFVYLAQSGDIGFLDEPMAVYRMHEQGINSGSTRLQNKKNAVETLKFFQSYKRISNHMMMKKSMARCYFQILRIYFRSNNHQEFNKYFIYCLRYYKFLEKKQCHQMWKMVIKTYFPRLLSIYHRLSSGA